MKRRAFLQSMVAAGAGALLAARPARAGISEPNVLIVGGGIGGQAFVRALNVLLPSARVSCVDPGTATAVHHGITRVSDVVVDLDFHSRMARTAGGLCLGYDVLVLSPGADIRWGAIEGYTAAVAESMPHGWLGDDRGSGLRSRLGRLPAGATVIVYVPGGVIRFPAGVKQRINAISTYLSRHNPRARLVVLDARRHARKDQVALRDRHMEWIQLSAGEDIVAVDAGASTLLSPSHSYRAELINLIPPQQAGKIAQRCALVNAEGWCPVDGSTGQSLVQPGVFVLGDASAADNTTKSAFTASAQALKCVEHLASVCA